MADRIDIEHLRTWIGRQQARANTIMPQRRAACTMLNRSRGGSINDGQDAWCSRYSIDRTRSTLRLGGCSATGS
jgi:hypothetical protein